MSDSNRTGTGLLTRVEAPPWDQFAPRFPIVRRGYDRDAVDDYIGELERELDDLRVDRAPAHVIAAEIERIGKQTAEILRVAHEQAGETTRRAHAEADRCLKAAAANAVAMTEDAKAQLRQLDAETDAVWRERARLLEDVRGLAGSLSALADEALARFPAEGERAGSPSVLTRGSEPEPGVLTRGPESEPSALTTGSESEPSVQTGESECEQGEAAPAEPDAHTTPPPVPAAEADATIELEGPLEIGD